MIHAEVTIRGSQDSDSYEVRLKDAPLDGSKETLCMDVVDTSKAEEALVIRVQMNAEDLLEGARMLVARKGKVTARY